MKPYFSAFPLGLSVSLGLASVARAGIGVRVDAPTTEAPTPVKPPYIPDPPQD